MISAQDRVAVREAVTAYGDDVHAALCAAAGVGKRGWVASPLGAWLLLALLAPADAQGLRAVVRLEPEAAVRVVDDLLAHPHPAVAAALAVWARDPLWQKRFTEWAEALPSGVERGDVPSQEGADAWTKRATLGLVQRFPASLDGKVLAVLVSALATRVRWEKPFDVVGSGRLHGPWSRRVTRVLATPERDVSHRVGVVADDEAGDLGVHATASGDGLRVVSVIAAADVPASVVLRAAQRVAVSMADDDVPPLPGGRDLFDLPLGEGPAWTLSEEVRPVPSPDGRMTRARAVLPAWSLTSDHDLLDDERWGFRDGAQALAALMAPGAGLSAQARQVALARYTARGFEAAAVTMMAVATGARLPVEGRLRTLEVRFGHPYAVVAVARQQGRTGWSDERFVSSSALRRGPWHGLPVFSAWVDDPVEAED